METIRRNPPLFVAVPIILLMFSGLALMTAGRSALPAAAQTPGSPADDGNENLPAHVTVQTVLANMDSPIAMAFDPYGRLFYTEKTGAVRLYHPLTSTLQSAAVINFSVNTSGERGLLDIVLDPNFTSNRYIYVYYTASAASENRVVRFVENNGTGSSPTTLFTSPQTGDIHAGGGLAFGSDGKLYISIGDNSTTANAQDVTVKNGKIHRINSDGTIPADNPVFTQTGALPSLYARGLRNSFDVTADPLLAGNMFASENGPSCDDEVNRIVGGYNYGWRSGYPCDDPNPSPTYNTIPPVWFLDDPSCCEAPTGLVVYTGTQIPEWTGDLFVANYNTGDLRHIYLNGSRTAATAVNNVLGISVNMEVATGPGGEFYYIEGGGYVDGTLKRIVSVGATTPTATRTPTRTATPAGPGTLVGHVVWEGRAPQPSDGQAMPVTLTLRSGGGQSFEYSAATDPSGFFTVSVAGLSAGTYQWRVKGPQFMASAGTTSLPGSGTAQREMGLQPTGDITNDNCVESLDFTTLKATFGRALGDPGYDGRADLSGDDLVDTIDFSFMRANFGQCGAAPIRREEPR